MNEDRTSQGRNSSAGPNIWRNTLSHIPTVFGRLVYLASLWEPQTGRYHHYGLVRLFGGEEADHMLRRSHAEVFSRWLGFTLEEQKHDLEDYLSDLSADKRSARLKWSRLLHYHTLVPADALEVERRLYASDFKILLELLKAEDAAASSDLDALPPR
jgi:hypothetical protein